MEDEVFLNTAQLQKRWTCCALTIIRLAKRGGLPFSKLGTQYRFALSDVIAAEQARKAQPVKQAA